MKNIRAELIDVIHTPDSETVLLVRQADTLESYKWSQGRWVPVEFVSEVKGCPDGPNDPRG